MDNIIRTTINKSELTIGMTVELDGHTYTVDKQSLSYCAFMGHSFRGSVYPRTITRIKWKVPTINGYRIEG